MRVDTMFGKCTQKAHLTYEVNEKTIHLEHAWWFPERGPNDGTLFGVMECNINKLIRMRPGKVGLGASYKSQLCSISKIEE